MNHLTDKELKLLPLGGQALIEGVLTLRGSRYLAAAYRTPEGDIVVETQKLAGIYTSKLVKIVRGLVILWDAMGLGTKYF